MEWGSYSESGMLKLDREIWLGGERARFDSGYVGGTGSFSPTEVTWEQRDSSRV